MLITAFIPEIASFLLFIVANTQRFDIGPILVLAQLALAGLLFLYRPRAFLDTLAKWWPLLLVPLLCVLSALWSTAPLPSLRYAVQLFFSAFIGVHIARLMTPERFVQVFFPAIFLFCLLSIADGSQGPSAEGPVLIGLTGSKNQMGFAGMLLALSAITLLMLPRTGAATRIAALLALPVSGFILFQSHAATALLMALAGALMLFTLAFVQRLSPGGRAGVVLGVVLILSPLLLLTPEINEFINTFMFDTLGKDPTLTGRTILWARADDLIAQRPILGWGYQAIWIGDSTETIALQRFSGIEDGRAFHFHHQIRQTGVDLGFLGMIALVGTMLATGFAGLRRALLAPQPATSFFLVVFVLTVARAMTDVVMQPFTMHTALFFAACAYAFWEAPSALQQRDFALQPLRLPSVRGLGKGGPFRR